MKGVYKEELIKEVIREQIFPTAPNEVSEFPLQRIVSSILKKENGDKTLINCMLEVKGDGILAVLMSQFRADKARYHLLFKFTDIQGIKIKEGLLNNYVTLQLENGGNYVFQVMRRNTKHFPNQREYMEHALRILREQNLNDMDSPKYRKNKMQKRVLSTVYVITLLIFEMIAIYVWESTAPQSLFAMFAFVIGTFIIHFILIVFIGLFIDHLRDRRFKKEYRLIVEAYRKTDDHRSFLQELQNMKYAPKTNNAKSAYYFSMSTALHKNNRTEEALKYLQEVDANSTQIKLAVEEQRKAIEQEFEA